MVGDGRLNDYVPWFRVYAWDGTYEDIPATMSQASGRKLKNRMFELFYASQDVRSVVVLSYDKSRVIKAVKRDQKGQSK